MSYTNQPLAGRSVILLEETSFLASYVADGVVAAGGEIAAIAKSVIEANAVMGGLRTPPNAIVVDVAIFEASAFEHRETVTGLAIPFLLISDRSVEPARLGHDYLSTPFAAYQVIDYICGKLGLELTRGLERARLSR